MKRSGFKRKAYKPMKRTKLRVAGHSTASELKRDIQALLREIVIKRDGGCVLRGIRNCHGEVGKAVLQADHLITRANSATYADSRLVVCLCRPCHGGFKQWHKNAYDNLVRQVISKERVELWKKCEKDSWQPTHKIAQDWKLSKLALEQELKTYA
jgi:hypothetical protein